MHKSLLYPLGGKLSLLQELLRTPLLLLFIIFLTLHFYFVVGVTNSRSQTGRYDLISTLLPLFFLEKSSFFLRIEIILPFHSIVSKMRRRWQSTLFHFEETRNKKCVLLVTGNFSCIRRILWLPNYLTSTFIFLIYKVEYIHISWNTVNRVSRDLYNR